jgi:ABC-type cobalamin/Fe3+-siderophores transport system ATPase subunit
MIITTGPTGSGKTTTLYAVLKKLNTSEVKIITLEDPIEYKLKGINQSQIDHSKGYDFAKGLRSILRQDPEIVMVGEIRDLETADIAIQAALTGHLMISTIHTNSAAGAIPRFLSMGVKPFLLAPALNAVIGQRLVRRLGADRSLEQFRADIKDMLTRQRTEAETKRREEELYDKVRSATSVELAPELIDTEVQEMVRDFVGRLKEQGSTFADWLTATNKKEEDVVKEMKEIAQSRIILRFGMQELANALEIEPAEDAMKAQLDSARASAKAEGHPLPEEELKSGGSEREGGL